MKLEPFFPLSLKLTEVTHLRSTLDLCLGGQRSLRAVKREPQILVFLLPRLNARTPATKDEARSAHHDQGRVPYAHGTLHLRDRSGLMLRDRGLQYAVCLAMVWGFGGLGNLGFGRSRGFRVQGRISIVGVRREKKDVRVLKTLRECTLCRVNKTSAAALRTGSGT